MNVTPGLRALVVGMLLTHSVASAAPEGGPAPQNCTAPPQVRIVGSSAAGPDSMVGRFEVIVRDLANIVVNGSTVAVDFSGTPDAKLSALPPDDRWNVNCGNRSVRAFSNAAGICRFTILGGSTGQPGQAGPCEAAIYADGRLIRRVPASFYDLDGIGGLGANDVSLWMGDFGTQAFIGRSDYDANGRLGANDLSLWLGAFGAGGSTLSPSSYCP